MSSNTKHPGFYVVARDGDKRAELVGPFRRETDAAAEVEIVRERLAEYHPEQVSRARFSVEPGECDPRIGTRQGTKNRVLGYRPDLSGWLGTSAPPAMPGCCTDLERGYDSPSWT